MCSVSRSIRAVTFVFVLSMSGTAARAQIGKFVRTAANPIPLAVVPLGPALCTRVADSEAAAPRAATPTTDDVGSPCDTPALVTTAPVNPCNAISLSKKGCTPSGDPVQVNLVTMGKAGQKILRAREKVLKILESESGCTQWFREKDANPLATFRTVSFTVDGKGQEYVLEIPDRESKDMLHIPYVAKVFQAEGAYSNVIINRNGAFFYPTAAVLKDRREAGRLNFLSQRSLRVGPYWGDTLNAQVLALLHEFGHVIDLLPSDGEDVEGKSARNTEEVLRHCRAEVETSGKRSALSANR
jgi:hypothetical protein